MSKCKNVIAIRKQSQDIFIRCQLEKDHAGKHKYEGKSEGKLFRIEWWDELPVIEGLGGMYVEEEKYI